MDQGLYAKAEVFLRLCLEGRLALLGEMELPTVQARNNLAVVLDLQGKADAAEELWERCAESYVQLRGEGHPDTVQVRLNIVLLLTRQAKFDQAERICLQCMDALSSRTSSAPRSQSLDLQVMYAKRNLASIYSRQGRQQEAVALCKESVQDLTVLLGVSHPDTVRAQQSLGAELFNAEHYEEAAGIFEAVLRVKRSVYGDRSPSTLHSMHALAFSYKLLQRGDEAMALLKECVEGRCTVFGASHGDTISSMQLLALLHKDHGRFEDAVDLLKRCRHLTGSTAFDEDVAAGEYLLLLSERYKDQCKAFTARRAGAAPVSSASSPPPIRFRPVCPSGHSLSDSAFSSGPQAHAASFRCNACKCHSSPERMRRWICEKCDVDLCFGCVSEAGRALIFEIIG
jgi:tetratricopeptide (TPR) repeat protein